ncbi:MAG: helix-turn-helix transcriptional regulator [Mesorhizobium sp.]|nr:MAG: helix-turn-helix transcriptional regulator [Mesorhizobium sp.]
MTGEEMKELRQRVGLSQAELAAAIGMSRESIGRMERGHDILEKRTELAVRYVVKIGTHAEPALMQIHDDVARVLDDAAVRASPSIERTERLKRALENWTVSGGSDLGRQLLHRAQGVIGLINVTEQHDPFWHRTMSDLIQLKREWAAIRHDQ